MENEEEGTEQVVNNNTTTSIVTRDILPRVKREREGRTAPPPSPTSGFVDEQWADDVAASDGRVPYFKKKLRYVRDQDIKPILQERRLLYSFISQLAVTCNIEHVGMLFDTLPQNVDQWADALKSRYVGALAVAQSTFVNCVSRGSLSADDKHFLSNEISIEQFIDTLPDIAWLQMIASLVACYLLQPSLQFSGQYALEKTYTRNELAHDATVDVISSLDLVFSLEDGRFFYRQYQRHALPLKRLDVPQYYGTPII